MRFFGSFLRRSFLLAFLISLRSDLTISRSSGDFIRSMRAVLWRRFLGPPSFDAAAAAVAAVTAVAEGTGLAECVAAR